MTLHPTVIADCQARLAQGERASSIALKMTRLCERLGTTAYWLEADPEDPRRVEVLLRPGASLSR